MELDEYQRLALRTAERPLKAYPTCVQTALNALVNKGEIAAADELLKTFDIMILGLGLAGEIGEMLELIKKSYGHGHAMDREKLAKESGDVRWYQAALEAKFDLNSSFVASMNIEKLRARYPDGFSAERSQKRKPEDT
jgi:NTP pyrophosphatase (non-canonical NTP hydrolase)